MVGFPLSSVTASTLPTSLPAEQSPHVRENPEPSQLTVVADAKNIDIPGAKYPEQYKRLAKNIKELSDKKAISSLAILKAAQDEAKKIPGFRQDQLNEIVGDLLRSVAKPLAKHFALQKGQDQSKNEQFAAVVTAFSKLGYSKEAVTLLSNVDASYNNINLWTYDFYTVVPQQNNSKNSSWQEPYNFRLNASASQWKSLFDHVPPPVTQAFVFDLWRQSKKS